MSNVDTRSSGPQNNGMGTKGGGDGVVKQAQDLGRDMKGQASNLKRDATEAVKSQAENLKGTAKQVVSEAGEKLSASVSEQKAAGADYVGNIANIIRRAAYEFDSDIPQAGHYIRMAAAQLDNVSDAMRNRDMSEIVGNVQSFARKQPTAFFGAAVLLGFAAVRFLKSAPGNSMPSTGSTASYGTDPGGIRSNQTGTYGSNPRGTTAGM
jgi:gas vesicle protein